MENELAIEPEGVDFIVKSGPATDEYKKIMSASIAYYKAHGTCDGFVVENPPVETIERKRSSRKKRS